MIVVLIRWKIENKQSQIDAFLEYWKKEARIKNRTGLVGEFLNEVGSNEEYAYITWDLDKSAGDHFKTFINVGIWDDGDAFQEQIGQYFNDTAPLKDFEAMRRVRTVLHPACWRMGNAGLPSGDSDGVV